MPDTTTPNLGLVQPEVGGSNDSWGDKLNEGLLDIDAAIKAIADVASGAIQASGLTPNTVLAKNTAGLLSAVPVAEGTLLGRRAGGEIAAINLATLKTDLGLNNVDNFSRAQLETYFNTKYGTLGGEGPVGQPVNDLLTDISVTGIANNELLVGDGPNSIKRLAISAFMQNVLNSADAAAVATAIGAATTAGSITSNTGWFEVSVPGVNGGRLIVNFGTGYLANYAYGSPAYAKPYTAWAVPVVTGGSASTSGGDFKGGVRAYATSLAGFNVLNSDGGPGTYFWIAVGR
jgi:hypothetical protein